MNNNHANNISTFRKKKVSVGKIIIICIVAFLVVAVNVMYLTDRVIKSEMTDECRRNNLIGRTVINVKFGVYPEFSGTVKEIKAISVNQTYHKDNEYDTFKVVKVIVPESDKDEPFYYCDSIDIGESSTDISLAEALIRVAGPEGDCWFYADCSTFIFDEASDARGLTTITVGSEVAFAYGPKKDIKAAYVYAVKACSSANFADDSINETTSSDGEFISEYILLVLIPSIVGGALLICFILTFIKRYKEGDSLIPMIIVFILGIILALFIGNNIVLYLNASHAPASSITSHAPIIYLYTESDEPVNVQLELDGELTVTYPEYVPDEGWTVTASPDGTLTDSDGNTYPFLFWEGDLNMDYDLSYGYCVKGSETEEFLDNALAQLGLTETEAADFKAYWLPQMEGNAYNVITFQTTAFDDAVSHSVTPEPDTVIRVNMLWYASETEVEIEPQDLAGMNPMPEDRDGFVFVEWGGEVIDACG